MKIPNEGGWTFESSEIANGFNKHVREQLPWYDLATGLVVHFARHYLPANGVMYDIGASTGNINRACGDLLKNRNAKMIAIEPSEEMRKIYSGCGELLGEKAEDHDYKPFDVAVMFLTMMFVPADKRDSLINRLIERCNVGGCILIFDKCEPIGGYVSTVMYRLALAGKIYAGASSEDIVAKELSLAGCQRPFTPNGYDATEVFRFGDFAGWIVEKK